MVLKFTYRNEEGKLECYQNYTIAQNSSQANTIVVTSTDPNAQNYNYCLEFVCYNYQNLPKSQYVSPILEYTQEGILFVIPAGLTQYKGHVEMQLIGYSIDDNSIVFKSINKGAKAFDVEGSLNVVENEVANTPNIFTEFLEELAYYRQTRDEFENAVKEDTKESIASAKREFDKKVEDVRDSVHSALLGIDEKTDNAKQDIDAIRTSILQEAERIRAEMASAIRQEIIDSLEVVPPSNIFYKVTFRINGEIIKSITVGEGATLTPPQYDLPDGCEVVEGWYDMSKDKLWNFNVDTVQEDVTLTLNFMSTGIGIAANGKIKDFANLTGDIYLPDYYNGKKVTNVDTTVTNLSDNVNLHFGYNMNNHVGAIKSGNQVKNLYFPQDGRMRNRSNGVYSDAELAGMVAYVFAPRDNKQALYIQSDCQQLATYCISNNKNLKKITIPPTVTGFNSNCIVNTGITSLTVPSSVTFFNSGAVLNNVDLKSVYLEGDMSEIINSGTFIDSTQSPSVHPTLYVRPEHYANYIKRNLQNYYTIEVMGKEYLDENYNSKETEEE